MKAIGIDKMSEEEKRLLQDLKKELESSESKLQEYWDAIDSAIATYKSDYPKPQNRSHATIRHAKTMHDNFVAQLFNDFYSEDEAIMFRPKSLGKDNGARIGGKYMNHIWNRRFPKAGFLEKILRSITLEGMFCIRTGWRYDYNIVDTETFNVPLSEVTDWTIKKKEEGFTVETGTVNEENDMMEGIKIYRTDVIEDRPDADVKNMKNMRWDVTAESPHDMRWIAEEMTMSMSDIRKQDIAYNSKSQMQLEDVDKWIENLYWSKLDEENKRESVTSEWSTTDLQHKIDDYANKHARDTFTIKRWYGEYDWDGDGIAELIEVIFTDDFILKMSPYKPFKGMKFPYVFAYFIKHNGESGGEGMMTSLDDAQRNTVALWRMLMDYVARTNLGEKVVNTNQIVDPFEYRKLEQNLPGTIYRVQGDGRTAITSIPQTAFPYGVNEMFQLTQLEEQKMSRVQENTAGVFNSAGSAKTATAAAIAAQGLNNFSQFIFTKVSEALREMFDHWLIYMNEFIDPDADIVFADIVGDDMVDVKAGDFIDYYDVETKFNSRGMAELQIQQINTLIMNSQAALEVGAITPDELALLYRRLFTLFGERGMAQRVNQRIDLKNDDKFREAVATESQKAVKQFMESDEVEKEIDSRANEKAKIIGEYEAQRRFKQYTDTLLPQEDVNVLG